MMRACDWAVRISASHIVGHAIDPWKDLIFVSIRGEKQKQKNWACRLCDECSSKAIFLSIGKKTLPATPIMVQAQ